MELHAVNRNKLWSRMSDKLKSLGRDVNGVILLQGGEEHNRYDTDHTPLFRQESYFAYLFGVKEPGFFGSLDLHTKSSALFCPRLDEEYAVWLGHIQPPSFFKDLYGVDEVHYVDELAEVLASKQQEPDWSLYLLHGKNTDSGSFSQPAEFEGMERFPVDKELLHPVLSECRVHKSPLEMDLMRYVCKVLCFYPSISCPCDVVLEFISFRDVLVLMYCNHCHCVSLIPQIVMFRLVLPPTSKSCRSVSQA